MGKPPWRGTGPTQPESALCGRLEWVPGESWESEQARSFSFFFFYILCDTAAHIRVAEISVDLREVVAHYRWLRIMRYRNPLYFTLLTGRGSGSWENPLQTLDRATSQSRLTCNFLGGMNCGTYISEIVIAYSLMTL